MVILIALATFISTILGGLFSLRFKDKLHLVLGFSAGAVITVAFLDLMPEAIELAEGAYGAETVLAVTALGFLIYLGLDRLVFFHAHHGEGEAPHGERHTHQARGVLGAGSFALHSLFDGMAVGLAFQVSHAVGVIVGIAILLHNFSDGVNSVNMILKNFGHRRQALKWLLIVATAPVLGALSTLFFTVSAPHLAMLLALSAGFFLYIGATDLIPESHHAHPKVVTTLMTLLGVVVLAIAIELAHAH